jgi:cell division protein FtsW
MEKIEKKSADYSLILLIMLMLGIGAAVLYSASYAHAERLGKSPYHFFTKQLIFIGIGGLVCFVVSCTPLQLFRRAIPLILLTSLVLTLLTFVPQLSHQVQGARRWLFVFGQSFQPSELVKVALIIYLASILSKKESRINDPFNAVVPPLLIVSLFVSVILVQNDFSTALFIFCIAVLIFYVARIKIVYFLLLGVIVIPLGVILLFAKEHRLQRILTFLDPLRDPAGSGFQVLQAKQALVSGGFWGRGLGMGSKKMGDLPEAHSDFIFAVIGEELGFLGMLFILALFILFAYRGYSIAANAKDSYRYYLAFGVTSIIFLQAILNMAVVAGMVPATGVPLPFFSSGGSSMLMSLVMVGLLINVSRDTGDDGRMLLG